MSDRWTCSLCGKKYVVATLAADCCYGYKEPYAEEE